MKKSLVIFLIFLNIAVYGMFACIHKIYEEQDGIVITEDTLAGERSVAQGLEAIVRTQWRTDRIRWETKLNIYAEGKRTIEGEQSEDSQTYSELRYHMNERKLSPRSGAILSRQNDVLELIYEDGYHIGYAENAAVNAAGEGILGQMRDHSFYQMFADVAKDVPAGASITRQVHPADYFSHYPLSMNLRMDVSTVWYVDEWNMGNFLGIRVPESHVMNITITKNYPNGAVTEIAAEPVGGSLSIKSPAVTTDNGLFYSIYAVKSDDGVLISPELEHENGIYCLPFTEEENGRNMKSDEMRLVFKLTEEECPVGLLADDLGEKLYLAVKRGKELLCKVVALDYSGLEPGMAPKAQEIMECSLGDYPENNELFLMEWKEGSLWMVFYDGTILFQPDIIEFSEKKLIRSRIEDNNFAYGKEGWDYDLDYSDGRLALICSEQFWNCSFQIYVFDASGLLYHGAFRHSLDAQNATRDYCLVPENALEIIWK